MKRFADVAHNVATNLIFPALIPVHERKQMINRKLLAVLIALIMFALPTTRATLADEAAEPYVEVSGTGTASGQPDTAMISLTVLRLGKTARAALNANNDAMASVLSGLMAEGIAKADLQTSGFSMQPRYVYPKPGKDGQRPAPVLTGYAVSNQLSVRVRDLERVGILLDKAVSMGINKIGNIRFSIEDASALREQARIKAMQNATLKAATLTVAGNVSLGKILAIQEHQSASRPRPMMQAQRAMMESASKVPVAAGEVSYAVTVKVRWALMP
jgi:uncharacterized protein